jgi:hypothetical protein
MMLAKQEDRMTRTKEYNCWISMKQRCGNSRNPAYRNYGGRGIRVCQEWQNDFSAFFAHIGKSPEPNSQVDRINNNGNYEPGNVRWTTPKENMRNTRANHIVTHNGKTAPLSMVCEEAGISLSAVSGRLRLGHSLQESLSMPLRRRGKKRYVKYQGQRISVGNLSTLLGMPKDVLAIRLKRGWTLERATTTPVK